MVTLQNVTLSFRDGKTVKTVLNDLSLTFPEGKTIVVMGPSGCGKTTLLRIIAGLESPDTGNVTRETESISYLFQDTALLPWLTAQENVNLVLSDKKDTLTEALEWLSRVELADEANTHPASLSGGMRQRVALARALSTDAELLLLDEPFRGMDEDLHVRMRELIRECRKGKTTVLVTHDAADAELADVLVVFDENRNVTIK
ncbi:MAG: ATP-binding cassette domain-containing protein [Ruminococcaceae bacterium]|nr:ATP-binding cassette domain-containing protein [Oscillospiraceae bacterium]